MSLTSLILAGGGSSRMGQDKAILSLGHKTVLDRIYTTLSSLTGSVIVNSNVDRTGYKTVSDKYQDGGPLAGLHSGFLATEGDWLVVSACDTPFIHLSVYEELLQRIDRDTQAVIPYFRGRHQPMSGIYHRSVLEVLEGLLQSGERKVSCLLERIQVNDVHEFEGVSQSVLAEHFFNMNTLSDYEEAKQMLKTSRL